MQAARISTSTIAVVMMNAFFRMPSRRVKRKTVHISPHCAPPTFSTKISCREGSRISNRSGKSPFSTISSRNARAGASPPIPNSQPSAVSSIRRRPCASARGRISSVQDTDRWVCPYPALI